MTDIILSIIIPIYNVEHYLGDCLESLVNQKSNFEFEVILVDDGSLDKSSEIADYYANKHSLFRVYHRTNQGASSARNFGIEQARGKYISFIDSDDFVSETYINILADNLSNDIDILYFSLAQFYEDGCITHFHRMPFFETKKDSIERRILSLKDNSQHIETFSFTVNKCFKRDIIIKHKIRFIEDLFTREDDIFTNEYCRYIKNIKYVDEILYFYRIGHSSLTTRYKPMNELLLLAQHMDASTSWITNPDLKKYQTTRILNFYMDATTSVAFPSLKIAKEIASFCKRNRKYGLQGRFLFAFKHNILIAIPLFYAINVIMYSIRKARSKYHD